MTHRALRLSVCLRDVHRPIVGHKAIFNSNAAVVDGSYFRAELYLAERWSARSDKSHSAGVALFPNNLRIGDRWNPFYNYRRRLRLNSRVRVKDNN